MHHALGIDQQDVALLRAHRDQQVQRGDAGRAGAEAHDLGGFQRLALHMQGVDEARADDGGGAMLVIVEYRDVEFLLQRRFDFETVRRCDVFEVDSTEGRGDRLHHLDEILRRLCVDFDVVDVDPGELLE